MAKTVGIEFTSKVAKWAREAEQKIEQIRKESIKRVARVAADNVPVDTGFAKASMEASTKSMPQINPSKVNTWKSPRTRHLNIKRAGLDFSKIDAVIDSATLGQTVYIGWTAAYILPLEYGHSQQAPAGFARLAAAQWPIIVNQVASEMKASQ